MQSKKGSLTDEMLDGLHSGQREDTNDTPGASCSQDRSPSLCVIAPGNCVEVLLWLWNGGEVCCLTMRIKMLDRERERECMYVGR